jgi:hypothetical protein
MEPNPYQPPKEASIAKDNSWARFVVASAVSLVCLVFSAWLFYWVIAVVIPYLLFAGEQGKC